jgi:hypothetical protein
LRRSLKRPYALEALVLFARLPKSDAYIASAELAVAYCRRIDKGDKPPIDEINALDDAVGGLLNNIDYSKPEIEKASKTRSTFNPRYH